MESMEFMQKTEHEVRKAHHQLGHCDRAILLRMAKMADKSEDHLFYIRHWTCPLCWRRRAPGRVSAASGHVRPKEFNLLAGMDLKYVSDSAGTSFAFLNILDLGTKLSVFGLCPTKGEDSCENLPTFLGLMGRPA